MTQVFNPKNNQQFVWNLKDLDTDAPIDNAQSVKATLYAGRSRYAPDMTPGTVVDGFNDKTLTHLDTNVGDYGVEIVADQFNPCPGSGYVIVVDYTLADGRKFHREEDVTIEI